MARVKKWLPEGKETGPACSGQSLAPYAEPAARVLAEESAAQSLLKGRRSVRVTTANGCHGPWARRQRPACLRFEDPAAGTPGTVRSGHQTARTCQLSLDKLQTHFQRDFSCNAALAPARCSELTGLAAPSGLQSRNFIGRTADALHQGAQWQGPTRGQGVPENSCGCRRDRGLKGRGGPLVGPYPPSGLALTYRFSVMRMGSTLAFWVQSNSTGARAMNLVVRAIDVGFGNTKFVTGASGSKVTSASFPSMCVRSTDEDNAGVGGRRRTVMVPVGGFFYEVGPEVELGAQRHRSRTQHDGFTETHEYKALMAGALHYMKVDKVDLLVVGLPVAQYVAKRSALERALTRTYDLGGGKSVEVGRVLVMAQPQGALIDYAQREGVEALAKGRSLVVDVGSRTFDWLVTRGMKVEARLSNSVPRGVWSILTQVARKISKDIGEEFNHMEAIDEALRSGKPMRIYQRDYDLKPLMPFINASAEDAVMEMVQGLDTTFNVENILLVGGGAFLYKKALKKQFPRHQIREVQEPMFANLRGFQRMGEQYATERPELFGKELGQLRADGHPGAQRAEA